jgi:hypothetical protein
MEFIDKSNYDLTPEERKEKAIFLMDKLRAIHKESPIGTLEELMKWKDEGRK